MTDEQRVREVLRSAVDDIELHGDGWADVEARAASAPTGRARRPFLPLLAAAAAAAVLVIVSLAVVLTRGDENGTRVVTPAESTTTTPPPTTIGPPTTVTTVAPRPGGFFATRDGSSKLVFVDASTGTSSETYHDVGDRVIESLSAHRGFLYYSLGPEPIVGELYRFRTMKSMVQATPERVGNGTLPTVSPVGGLLAFARDTELVVLDMSQSPGVERTHQFDDAVTGIEWSADGRELFVLTVNSAWRRMDASLSGPLQPLMRSDTGASSSAEWWIDAEVHPSGLIAFVVASSSPERDRKAVAVVDPRFGEIVGGFTFDKPVSRIDLDASGRHMLFTGSSGIAYAAEWPVLLNVQHPHVSLAKLADNVSLAVW